MRWNSSAIWLAFSVTLLGGRGAAAQLQAENLLQTVPAGFKVGYRAEKPDAMIVEWVPVAETVENWSEMITTQIFRGKGSVSPADFLRNIGGQWMKACPDAQHGDIQSGTTNAYPVSILLLTCPKSPMSGTAEATLFRIIQGKDALYSVQYAFRGAGLKQPLSRAADYLRTVQVCDTRAPDHPCPPVKAPRLDRTG